MSIGLCSNCLTRLKKNEGSVFIHSKTNEKKRMCLACESVIYYKFSQIYKTIKWVK